MRTLYATQLQITSKELSAEDAVLDLTERIHSWVRTKYDRQRPRWGEAALAFPDDGGTIHPIDGHELTGRLSQGQRTLLSSLTWRHPDDSDDSIRWVIQTSIARLGQELQLLFVVGVESRRLSLRPTRYQFGRPAIVTEILDAYPTRIDGWSVPREVRRLERADVEAFVADVLLSPDRRLPVALISCDVWSDRPFVDPEDARRALDGSADVAVLADKFAGFDLTEEVGKAFACYDGAVRVYWPGMSLDDNPRHHPLYLSSTLRRYRERGQAWEQAFASRLAGISAMRFSQSDLLHRVRRELVEEQKAEAKRKVDEAATGHVSVQDLLHELELAMKRAEEAEADNEQLHARIEQLEYLQDWRQLAPDGEDGSANDDEGLRTGFATILQAVEEAKRQFSGPLLFLDSALESAADSPFNRPDDVFALLEAIHAVAGRWKDGDGSLGTSWDNALAEHGYEYKARISETTKGRWGYEYEFSYKGEKRLFEAHVTLGAKAADTCVSVHWYRDDDDLVLVVGHVGRHLRNTKT